MRSRLTETTFYSGPTDEVATLDAYEKEDSLLTNINSIPEEQNTPEMESIKGGNSLSEEKIADAELGICKRDYGLELDPDSLLKGIISNNNELLSGLKSLPADMQKKLLTVNSIKTPGQELYKNTRNDLNKYSNVIANVGGVSKTIVNANLATLNGLGTMMNSLACDKSLPMIFNDLAGLANLITNLIKECSRLGIPNPFSGIVNCIQDYMMLRSITKNLIPTVIKTSDTSLLKQMSYGQTARDIPKYSPNFANDYITNYRKPPFATTADIAREYTDINSSLTRIDPKWNVCRLSDYDSSMNASSMSTASEDFRRMERVAANSGYVNIDSSDSKNINTAVNTNPARYYALTEDYDDSDAGDELDKKFPLVIT